MLMLPRRPTRSMLRAFALVGGLLLGALLAGTALLARLPAPVAWGAPAACATAYAGWSRPYAFTRVYGWWNRAAAKTRRLTRAALAGICFLVFTVVGFTGGRLRWKSLEAGGSGWFARKASGAADLSSPADVPLPTAASNSWLAALTSWARETGAFWIWTIVPLLALLRSIEPDQELDVGHTSYTLY